MAGPNKIITVSYGTFSCTLEGFEDSFGTMTAIAEYFRGLAAQDPHFGAEPAGPDAGTIQQIAERTSRQPVETRLGMAGMVIRPTEPGLDGAAPAPVPDRAHSPSGPLTATPEPETVAAKLARIRAVVEGARAEAPTEAEVLSGPATGTGMAPAEIEERMPAFEAAPPGDFAGESSDDAGAFDGSPPDGTEPTEDRPAPHAEPHDQGGARVNNPAPQVLKLRRSELVEDGHPAPSAADVHADTAETANMSEQCTAQAAPQPDAGQPAPDRPVAAEGATGDAHVQNSPEPQPQSEERFPPLDSEQDDKDILRLLDEANSKLSGPEHQRRRTAIAHLKAAVAATVADRDVQPGDHAADDERRKRPYRQVLARIVRGAPEGRGAQPGTGTGRLAPLVLVSELRVDIPHGDPRKQTGVIRAGPAAAAPESGPERTGDEAENIFSPPPCFDDFAAARMAEDASALLAAAGEYLTTVDGQAQFARADVVALALGHLGEEALRDDLIPAFERLLRDGTFRKADRGAFSMPQFTAKGTGEAARRQA